jgi:hypothetical protein
VITAPKPAETIPNHDLKADLWAAAAIVAKAAEVAPLTRPEPVSVVSMPVRTQQAAAAEQAPAVAASSMPAPGTPISVPAHVAASRKSPDAILWIMFGSAAAFLFIIWIAIFAGVRW